MFGMNSLESFSLLFTAIAVVLLALIGLVWVRLFLQWRA